MTSRNLVQGERSTDDKNSNSLYYDVDITNKSDNVNDLDENNLSTLNTLKSVEYVSDEHQHKPNIRKRNHYIDQLPEQTDLRVPADSSITNRKSLLKTLHQMLPIWVSQIFHKNISSTDDFSDSISATTIKQKHIPKQKSPSSSSSSVSLTSKKSICSFKCKHFFSVLFILFCLLYLLLYIRPEYGVTMFGIVESILKKYNLTSEEYRLRPGEIMAKYRRPSMPVIIVPGIISTALEMWNGKKCTKGRFRQRFWTSIQMVTTFGSDHLCWLEHLSLNITNWEDPIAIKLRPVLGMSAADYVFPGYWLWSKVLENLADLGYDTANLLSLGYDWRLPPQMLEERDGYFTQLKFYVEFMRKKHNKKVALISHSMGTNYVFYFLRWVTENSNNSEWIDDNIEAFLNVGGPLLGTSKAFSSVLSGEMKDTSILGDLGRNILGRVLGKLVVFPRFFRSLGSIPSMFPKGGPNIWSHCTDNKGDKMLTFSKNVYDGFAKTLIHLRKKCEEEISYKDGFDSILEEIYTKPELMEKIMTSNHSVNEFYTVLKKLAPRYMQLVEKYYNFDDNASRMKQNKNETLNNSNLFWKKDDRTWTNPLVAPLPMSKHLKIYCMYGYIKEPMTECGYQYGFYSYVDHCSSALLLFNTSATNPNENLKKGVYLGAGDATVSLVSLGYMCAGPWKQKGSELNPQSVKTIIREYIHKTTTFDILTTKLEDSLRGGPYAVTHVELLGNRDFLEDMLIIVSEPIPGTHPTNLKVNDNNVKEDRIYSNIKELSKEIMKADGYKIS